MAQSQEVLLNDSASSEGETTFAAGSGGFGRHARCWLLPVALASVLAVAGVLASRQGGSRAVFAEVADSISESHYSQTRSYQCNKALEVDLDSCISNATTSNSTQDSNATNATNATQNATNDKCKALAHMNYKGCCQQMSKGRCSFPCTETCMQQYGTITKDYKTCCKKCPGKVCVDPWKLLDEFY